MNPFFIEAPRVLRVQPNAPDEERALACLLNPVDGPGGRIATYLFKARAPRPGRWAADRRPIVQFHGREALSASRANWGWAKSHFLRSRSKRVNAFLYSLSSDQFVKSPI